MDVPENNTLPWRADDNLRICQKAASHPPGDTAPHQQSEIRVAAAVTTPTLLSARRSEAHIHRERENPCFPPCIWPRKGEGGFPRLRAASPFHSTDGFLNFLDNEDRVVERIYPDPMYVSHM